MDSSVGYGVVSNFPISLTASSAIFRNACQQRGFTGFRGLSSLVQGDAHQSSCHFQGSFHFFKSMICSDCTEWDNLILVNHPIALIRTVNLAVSFWQLLHHSKIKWDHAAIIQAIVPNPLSV